MLHFIIFNYNIKNINSDTDKLYLNQTKRQYIKKVFNSKHFKNGNPVFKTTTFKKSRK